MSNPPLLELDGVTKRFAIRGGIAGGVRGHVSAVRDVSLIVRRGEVFGLAGESGSGKSTIARMIVGLARPDAGTIRFAGRPVGGSREIQMVFQNPGASLNPRRSVGQSLAVPLAASGAGRAARGRRIAELLGLVQLPADTASRYPHELSGGQKQRVAIARAIAAAPRLLVLDEPTSALDVSVQAKIMELLVELGRSLDLTYIFISHDLSLMRNFADRVGVLYLGEVVESGTTDALFGSPAHPYTRTLLASIPVVSPEEARLRPDIPLIEGEIPNAADLPPGCVFHPRCPYAFAPCVSVHPGFTRATAGQMARCHLVAGGASAVHDMTTREQPA